ncbi:MAG: DUF5688 family protein [Roseburia sp.]|nr:DUF5688 family protein [Roseburia sp.]
MNYHEFKENLLERVKKDYAGADIYIETVGKNNGTRKERLVIRGGGKRLVPCIHLNELYQCHEETEDMELCVKMIKQLAEPKGSLTLPERMWTWEECRGRILLRLISRKWNREHLETVPHKEFLDLAVTFHLMVEKSGDMVYSMPVTNEVMNIWGTDADGLFRDGMEHLTEHSHFSVNGIYHFIARLLEGKPGAEPEKKMTDFKENKITQRLLLRNMLVLSAIPYCFGSAGMLATEFLKETAGQIGAFYILPCSVHELILMPVSTGADAASLKEIVRRMNRASVNPEERLSDSIYYFNPESGEVELAEEEFHEV